MQYALLIYEKDGYYEPAPGGMNREEAFSNHRAFQGRHGGLLKGGAGLEPTTTARTVRVAAEGQGRTVHDGPFAETREQLGGFYLVDAPDLDAAIAIARDLPLAADGAVEIRPLLTQG